MRVNPRSTHPGTPAPKPYQPPVGPSGWKDAGKQLMAKTKRQPLTQFLNSQCYNDRGKRNFNVLGIPPMDALINEILNPVLVNPGNFPARLRLPVIEISSRGSHGKTHLLYYICAVSTLPTQLGGKNRAVVVIDCLCKFDVDRLYMVMKRYAKKKLAELTSHQLDKLLAEALKHVHIFQPEDSNQLLQTIRNLRPYLYGETEHKHYSAQKVVDCIMIDGISHFIWEDRVHDYSAVMVPEDHPHWINLRGRYDDITKELRAAATALCCFIVATNIGFMGRYDPDKAPVLHALGERPLQYRPQKMTLWQKYHEPWRATLPPRPPNFTRPYLKHVLPQPWTPFVNVKLVVQREKLPRFKKGTPLELALSARGARLARVREGRFVGFADPIGLGGGLQKAVQAVNRGSGSFYFYITEDGVDVTT